MNILVGHAKAPHKGGINKRCLALNSPEVRQLFLIKVGASKARGGGTSLCRVYGYVPPTRVDFSLPKIQNRPQILKFYSRTGPTF